MKHRIIFLTGFLCLLLLASPASAGGWVVITVDTLPAEVQARNPTEVTFIVRQHGKTPIDNVTPLLTATNTETGEKLRVAAEKAPGAGRFTVTVNFPEPGLWRWSLSAEPFPNTIDLAPLTVTEPLAGISPAGNTPAGQPLRNTMRWGGILVLAAAAAFFILDWRREDVVAPAAGD